MDILISMKRFFICFLAAAACIAASAQNRSINFAPEDITAEEMFAQASEQGKLIFMDCYASWCGPCKQMAANIFTKDEVADFYNQNFFCVKFDMEKGEGAKLNKQYGIGAFPTFLFIDPKTTFIVHTAVGGRGAQEFIELGKKALDPSLTEQGPKQAYEAGDRSKGTVTEYLKMLQNAHLYGMMNDVAAEYLDGMSAEEIVESENWTIFEMGVSSLDSKAAQTVFADKDFFCENIGEKQVNGKLTSIVNSYTREFTHSKAVGPDENFDRAKYETAKAFVEKCGLPSAPGILLQMKATEANSRGDVKGVLDCLNENLKKNTVPEYSKQFFTASNVARLTQASTKKLRKKSIKFLDNLFKAGENDLDRANALRMKGIVLEQYGETEASAQAMELSMEYAKKNAAARQR